tara:strand:- start:91 stop:1308 length:1218 start_codon:yes stop_codon:yes gene_type:complete
MTDKHQIADDLTTLAYPIEKLKHLDGNPRKGNVEAVKKSYEKFGQRKPIVATKDGEVISGNHQLAAARELGWNKIAVVFTNDDELTAKAFALADNRTADLGTYDDDLLADMLGAVASDLEMLEATSFTEDDLFQLIGFNEIEEKELPKLPTMSKTKFGDKYKLGNHFLICGDATDINNYKIGYDLLITDPPYGVDYSSKNAMLNSLDNGNRITKTIENDNLTEKDLEDIWNKVLNNCYIKSNKNSSYYIFGANLDNLFYNLQKTILNNGFLLKHLLIWKKNNFVLSRTDYKYNHEPILYGWKSKESHNFYGNNNLKSVLEFDKPRKSNLHPTMKPVELLKHLILNSTKKNDIVLDPFIGSGSTLIACEELKRNCYGIEIDENYCDVIIERWENSTGQKAELIESL